MKHITKNPDGTYTVILHLKEEEFRRVKKLSRSLGLNDFESIKHAIQLVAWWSKNQIEPEDE